jgi:HK97 family phage major capsid protein
MGLKETYSELIQQAGELNAENVKVWEAAGDEPLVGDTKKALMDRNRKIEEIEVKAAEILEQIELHGESMRRKSEWNTPARGMEFASGNGGESKGARERKVQTLGEMFTEAKAFKDYLNQIAPQGRIVQGTPIRTPAVPIGSMKALITGLSDTSAGALVESDRIRMVDAGTFYRPLTIRGLITTGTTGSDVVPYVRQGTHVNAAAPVAEATGTSDGTGEKPESTMVLDPETAEVKTVAHWIPASVRALSDAGQMRMLIDSFLRYGLEEALEDQMINGDDVGENFLGILATPNIGTQAYSTSLLETTRKARTKVKTEGRAQATAYVLNPLDWEALDLLQDGENRYYFGGPMVMGTPRLWGLPVVESEAIDQGVGLVADWRLAALWDRQETSIVATNSHSDFFVRNLIAIRAEMRAAFAVIRPAAFIEIDLTS